MSSYEIPAALAGERVDRVVALLTSCSRSEADRLVSGGAVLVGGRPVSSASQRLHLGERLEVNAAPAEQPLAPEPASAELAPLQVVYEDEDLLVIDKPAGLVVHPGAGTGPATLVALLLARHPALASTDGVGDPDRPGIVHRLDKDTSGLLAVALSPLAYQSLTEQLATRTMGRSYRAVVIGRVSADEGRIEAPIGRSRRDRTRMAVTRDGREARTSYRVLARYNEPVVASELVLRLETGRTHQIRVHCAAIEHPVLGDTRYGGGRARAGLERPFLHAEGLQLVHPRSGEQLSFESPLPPELVNALARFS